MDILLPYAAVLKTGLFDPLFIPHCDWEPSLCLAFENSAEILPAYG